MAFGWNDYPVPRLAKPAVVPGGAIGATPKIWIPLPQYLHPFAGKLVLKQKNWDGASISSFRYSPKDNRCEVTITRIGSGGIGPQAWMCAYISEIAACNGSPDINGDQRKPDGTSLSLGDQLAYTGACAIGWTYRTSTSRSAAPDHSGLPRERLKPTRDSRYVPRLCLAVFQ